MGSERVVGRADEHRGQVADPRADREEQGDRGVDDEGRAGHDEREREEERAPLPPGERHEQGHEGDRERPLDDEPRGAQEARREQVVDGQHGQAGDGEDDEDGQLLVRPQARRHDHRRCGEDEQEARDPDDSLVVGGGHAVDERPVRIVGGGSDEVVARPSNPAAMPRRDALKRRRLSRTNSAPTITIRARLATTVATRTATNGTTGTRASMWVGRTRCPVPLMLSQCARGGQRVPH